MGSRTRFKQIQGPSTHSQGQHDYMAWQNIIEESCGVKCTVVVTDKAISIRTESYPDYLLAKSEVSKRTGMKVVRG
jgi:hypothetical protein